MRLISLEWLKINADRLLEQGYLLLEDFEFTADEVSMFHEAFHQKRSQLQSLSDWVFLEFLRNAPKCLDLLRATPIPEFASKLLAGPVDLYWDTVVTKAAHEGKEFAWHQDSGYGETDPDHYYTFWVPLQDVDQDNGGLWVLPGSHKKGLRSHSPIASSETMYPGRTVTEPIHESGEFVSMRAGQVLVFHSNLVHRSGRNQSAHPRTAMAFAIHRRGFREINRPAHLPEAIGVALSD